MGFYGGVCCSEIFHVPYTATSLASIVFYLSFLTSKEKMKQTSMTGCRRCGQYIIREQMLVCSYFSHERSHTNSCVRQRQTLTHKIVRNRV